MVMYEEVLTHTQISNALCDIAGLTFRKQKLLFLISFNTKCLLILILQKTWVCFQNE